MKTRKTQHLLILLATVLVGNLMILAAYWKSKWLPEPAQATVPQLHHWLVTVDFPAQSKPFRHDFAQRLEFEMGRPLTDIQSLALLAPKQQEKLRCNLQRLATDRLQEQRSRYLQLPPVKANEVLKRCWDWNLKWLVYRVQLLGPNHPRGFMISSRGNFEIYGELDPGLQSFADQVFEYGLRHENVAETLLPEQPCRTVLLQYFIPRTVAAVKGELGKNPVSSEACLQRNLRIILRAWCRSCAKQIHHPLSIAEQNALKAELPWIESLLACIGVQSDIRNGRGFAETWARVFDEVGGSAPGEAQNSDEVWNPDEVAIIQFIRARLEGADEKRERSTGLPPEHDFAF